MLAKKKKTGSRKVTTGFKVGIAHIDTTKDHTILTITDLQGEEISCSTKDFKNQRKGSSFLAYLALGNAITSAYESGIRKVNVKVIGLGSREKETIEHLRIRRITILSIRDVTPMPHN
jgi:small subunit ribosomal protein S11